MKSMVAFGNQFDLSVKCDVDMLCPVCQRSRLQLVWGRRCFRFCGIPTVTTAEGFYLKCARCREEGPYGPISEEVANDLQGIEE